VVGRKPRRNITRKSAPALNGWYRFVVVVGKTGDSGETDARVSEWRRRTYQAPCKTYPFTMATKTERVAILDEARMLTAMWTSIECERIYISYQGLGESVSWCGQSIRKKENYLLQTGRGRSHIVSESYNALHRWNKETRHLCRATLQPRACCQLADDVGLIMPIACSLCYERPRTKTAQSTKKEVDTPVPFWSRFTNASGVHFLSDVSNIRVSGILARVASAYGRIRLENRGHMDPKPIQEHVDI